MSSVRCTVLLSILAALVVPGASPAAQPGGTLTELAAGDVDFLDPGSSYYTFGFQVALATGRPLYSTRPGGVAAEPDLAATMPVISPDRKTVTVTLKPGVNFGPPVNREVRAADVKYAIERFFAGSVGGQYPGYFQDLLGAPSRPTRFGVPRIRGVVAQDDRTLVFRLRKPSGVQLAAALVLPITIPVPREYAGKFDAKRYSTYNFHVVSSGPYMVANNKAGLLTGYRPGRSITLVRNPRWRSETDARPAYASKIVIRTDAYDSGAAYKVLDGSNMVLADNTPPAPVRDAAASRPAQVTAVPGGGVRFLSLNTEVRPLNDLNVRRAILVGMNREALRAGRGGLLAGDVATHILPPGMPGFDEGGGLNGFTDLDFVGAPTGNSELAASYMRAAGYASGRYEGSASLLLVGANANPGLAVIRTAKKELERLGFRVRLKLVTQDFVYTDWCQRPAKKVAVCAAGWFKDFDDPQSMLEPIFRGDLIQRRGGNLNYSMLNDPEVDRAMDAAALLEGSDRYAAWATIDRMIMERAVVVPFVWDKVNLARSKNVEAQANPYTGLWDLSYTAVR